MARYVDIIKEAGGALLSVANPARYTGGEAGRLARREAALQTVIAFPDLYEIGMSNNAVRILYNTLNNIDDVSCGRAFAPAPDFEKLLKEKNIPLYDLDTGLALKDCDILMFSLSYELGITSLLAMLDTAGIPLDTRDRNGGDPLVIAGGPCTGNPLPYSDFIDAFWAGEAEDDFFTLIKTLRDKKKEGADKNALFDIIRAQPAVWTKGKEKAVRAIDRDFARRGARAYIYPLPSMRIVQAHSTVEIMRGCPNGCRFCFAGIWYRPARRKDPEVIKAEVDEYIRKGGAREISLSSLSSGDYAGIGRLVGDLNAMYSGRNISFQLPSLHISTLSLALLEKTNKVRKGGLTFAVETPPGMMQPAINKEITLESVVSLLREAKRSGYRTAKFYFMIGLPAPDIDNSTNADSGSAPGDAVSEEDAIISFINEAHSKTNMHFSINVGVFIPKPHTPFRGAEQLNPEAAQEKLFKILNALKRRGHKVSVHNAYNSFLEGILSRGDGRVCALIRDAFYSGCRLDAWSEFFKEDVWRSVIEKHRETVDAVMRGNTTEDAADIIQSGTTKEYLINEFEKSKSRLLTAACSANCAHPCGVCETGRGISVQNSEDLSAPRTVRPPAPMPAAPAGTAAFGVLLSYTKSGPAVFLSHLAMIEVFITALLRAGVNVRWSQGFNPIPKIEFAAPLSVGIESRGEFALISTNEQTDGVRFAGEMNRFLPEGIFVNRAAPFAVPRGVKKHSLQSLLWGFVYENGERKDFVKAADDKAYRAGRFPDGNISGLKRLEVLARREGQPASYFDVFVSQ